jgi:hypothetical protein
LFRVETAGLRTWFLRDLLASIERRERAAITRLMLRLPERLRVHLDSQALRDSSPTDVIPLDLGEELILAIDATLGDGSGRLLEEAAGELATRSLLRSTSGVVSGDLQATVARHRTALERPFVAAEVRFELSRNDIGFTLSIGVRGRPRSTKLLRHLTTGTIRSVHRFARESDADALRIYGETLGDRAELTVRVRTPSADPPTPEARPTTTSRRPPSRQFRSPTLSEEVDRIMNKAGLGSMPPASRPSQPRIPVIEMPQNGDSDSPIVPAPRHPPRGNDES